MYRAWFIENPPNDPQKYEVNSIPEAVKLLERLSIDSPAVVAVCGLEEYDNGEWVEWYDEDGNDICSMMFPE